MKRIVVVLLSGITFGLITSCSYEPIRKSTPSNAEIAADGRIRSRSSAENKKRLDHYNGLQHSGNTQKQ